MPKTNRSRRLEKVPLGRARLDLYQATEPHACAACGDPIPAGRFFVRLKVAHRGAGTYPVGQCCEAFQVPEKYLNAR